VSAENSIQHQKHGLADENARTWKRARMRRLAKVREVVDPG
jgi:hypothetical protein